MPDPKPTWPTDAVPRLATVEADGVAPPSTPPVPPFGAWLRSGRLATRALVAPFGALTAPPSEPARSCPPYGGPRARLPGMRGAQWPLIELSGAYELGPRVGAGAQFVVHQGRQRKTGCVVALKFVNDAAGDEACEINSARMYNIVRVAARAVHPNLVELRDFGTFRGTLCLVEAWLQGRTLASLIRCSGRLPWPRVVEIALASVRALGHLHNNGLVHRDFKPSNIFLDEQWDGSDRVVLTDYGILKARGASRDLYEDSLTEAGAVVGSPSYMAPEQARGLDLDGRADLYSLGVVCYRMLTGTLPFEGHGVVDLALKHCHEEPESMERRVPGLRLPAPLRRLVERLMAKDPEQRGDHAAALTILEALARAARGRAQQAPSGAHIPKPASFMQQV